MQKLPELTTVPPHHLDRLPYEVWGREAVQAADHGMADMLNAEAFQQHHEYMQGATASDEAGWHEHLTPLLDVYGEHMTPEKVHSKYGSYALLAAEAAEVTAQAYDEAGKGAQEAPEEVKRHLDRVRMALRDIPQDDHPDPKTREGGQERAALVDRVLNSHDDIPWTFRQWRIFDAIADDSPKIKGWTRWLANDATDAQLLNFMQWHNARIQEYNQDPKVRERIENRRKHYLEMLDQVYDAGYLHPAGRNHTMDVVHGANIYAGDDIERALTGVLGDVDKGRRFAVLQPALLLDTESTTFEHELSHFPIDADERWSNEMAADYLAGIIRTHDLNVSVAMEDMALDSASGYRKADRAFARLFKGKPDGAKAFLRWASAPHYLKAECRAELNAAFSLSEGQDALDMMRDLMTDLMPSSEEETAAA